jgi:hypothetical protein
MEEILKLTGRIKTAAEATKTYLGIPLWVSLFAEKLHK